jgi:hypothetical protein
MRLFSSHLLIVHSSSFTSSLFIHVGLFSHSRLTFWLHSVVFRLGAIVRIWLRGGDVVKSTTRWPRIVLSHVETTQTALENTQTHTDYQDYNSPYN